MGREDMINNPDYATNAKRVENKEEIVGIIENWLKDYKRDDALKILEDMQKVTPAAKSDFSIPMAAGGTYRG